MASRIKDNYKKEVIPALMKEFSYKNVMQVPQLAPALLPTRMATHFSTSKGHRS